MGQSQRHTIRKRTRGGGRKTRKMYGGILGAHKIRRKIDELLETRDWNVPIANQIAYWNTYGYQVRDKTTGKIIEPFNLPRETYTGKSNDVYEISRFLRSFYTFTYQDVDEQNVKPHPTWTDINYDTLTDCPKETNCPAWIDDFKNAIRTTMKVVRNSGSDPNPGHKEAIYKLFNDNSYAVVSDDETTPKLPPAPPPNEQTPKLPPTEQTTVTPDDIELEIGNEDEHKKIQDEVTNIQNEGIKSLLQKFIKNNKIQQANEGLILHYTIGLIIDDKEKRKTLYDQIIAQQSFDNVRL